MRRALRHPFGPVLLIISLVLAGLMRFLPGLERWSDQALWVLLLGLLAYAASVIALYRTRTGDSAKSPLPADNAGEASSDDGSDGQPSADLLLLVEQALRRLNNPADLSRCGLLGRVPGILSTARSEHGSGAVGAPGPLEQAQSLREVLVFAIEQLKPAGGAIGASAPEALQYYILHEEYVLKKSTIYITTRYSISESNFYRNRKAAVSAVARHLEAQEELIALSQQQPQ